MSIISWLRPVSRIERGSATFRRGSRPRRADCKLIVEQLEGRLCPSGYSVIDLGTLPGELGSYASAVNATGQVAGTSEPGTHGADGALIQHGFLWQQSSGMTALGTLGGPNSRAVGINKYTQVVGDSSPGLNLDTSGYYVHHAFLWQNGAMTDLGTLGTGLDSQAFAINGSAQVVGRSDTGDVNPDGSKVQHAFVWQQATGMIDLNSQLPANSGWVLTYASGINDNGQIAVTGYHIGQTRAGLLSGSVVTDLGIINNSVEVVTRALNNAGQVAGESYGSTTTHAVLYSGGSLTDLSALGNHNSIGSSDAHAINSSAQVVGTSTSYPTVKGFETIVTSAFLWQTGTITDLNNVLPKNSGWHLTSANGINDSGAIVGNGSHNGSYNHAFLMVPGSPLLASAQPIHGAPSSASITVSQVQPLLCEAVARWNAAGVNTAMLSNIQIAVADLPGRQLGFASGHTIYLDNNAAGWGWFPGAPGPADDSEFTTPGDQGEQSRMDLLTVLEHELGHVLGYDHDADANNVMCETLNAGERHNPQGDSAGGITVLDAVLAGLADNHPKDHFYAS